MRTSKSPWLLASGLFVGAYITSALYGAAETLVRAEKPGEEKRARDNSAIEKTKEKGFDGVDFSYDLFGGPPGQSATQLGEAAMAKDIADKPKVMAKHARLLKERYKLDCKTHSGVTMTNGKPQPIGPTVQLKEGVTWEALAQMETDEIRKQKVFPSGFMRLPHVKHEVGGQVFPQKQVEQFPRLERFDVEFDLPDCFLPEFPPPIFLTTHPELGDVSQGEVLSDDNFDRLFRGLITPVQLDGLRMLVTQFPQEEFNLTPDRKSPKPSWESRASIATSTSIRQGNSI
ncbi:MAG: hypothetical protein H0V35_08635 [Nitrospira sp.]|nr:hypothetical protein [Nitrospira sp.]